MQLFFYTLLIIASTPLSRKLQLSTIFAQILGKHTVANRLSLSTILFGFNITQYNTYFIRSKRLLGIKIKINN